MIQRQRLPQIPLLWVLVVPFVVQLAGSVGVVAYFYHRSAQRDLEQVADSLLEQANQRIRAELDRQLGRQQQALRVTQQALQQNPGIIGDVQAAQRIIWEKMQLSPNLSSLHLATTDGTEVGYGRLTNTEMIDQVQQVTGQVFPLNTQYLVRQSPDRPGDRRFYAVNNRGEPTQLAYQMDLRVDQLTWYQAAQSLDRQGWSPLFLTHTNSQLSFSALLPLRDAEGRFQGTLASFLRLGDISEFLSQLAFSPQGQAFILERSGALIASSTMRSPYAVANDGNVIRFYAENSNRPWLRAVSRDLLQTYGSFDNLEGIYPTQVRVGGELLYAEVQTYQDGYGLDWLLLLILPQSDVMPNLQASQQKLWWLWGGMLLFTTGLGWLTARLILAPLRHLNRASQALAAGATDSLSSHTAIAELAELTHTFNQMVATIQTTQADLNQSIRSLQASEGRFRKLFQSDVVGLILVDASGRIIDANDYFLALLGYDRQALEAGDLRWDTLTPLEYQAQDRQLAKDILQQGRLNAFEKDYFHREGHRVPVLISAVMVSDTESFCLVVDMRDRKRAERALRESRAFLQQITDTSPNILYVYDVQAKVNLYVSGAVQEILGYSVSETMAMGEHFFETLLPPDQLAQINADYAHIQTLADGETRSNEFCIHTATGETRWVFNRYTIFSRDDNGQVTSILGSVQDITVLKQAEAETQRLKDRLEFILATNPAALFTCGLDYTITFISQNIERMVGYTPREIIGWEGFWGVHIHPDDAERVKGEMAAFFQNGHSVHEYRWRHRDGQYRWMLNELKLVCDAQGQPEEEIVGYCIDISDRKQAEVQLQQTNEDLRRATRLKDEFLAAMSHELRTPLTAILGMTEGLLEEVFGPVTPQQIKALETVDRSGSHLLELINDILDVSKLESGQMTLDLTVPIDMVALCTASLAFVQPQAKAKAIQIATQFPPVLPRITIDERRMRQVLINLLSNAVKFTPQGGSVTLEASVQPATPDQPSHLCLAVRDTGIGIAAADQSRVFDPFIQIDSALNRKYEGTGLGLGLVKRLVELHGGHITLTSAPDEGSCFTVYLPYTADDTLAQVSPTGQNHGDPSPLIWLITEDTVLSSRLSSYLRGKGYALEVMGPDTLATLTPADFPALVILDTQALDGVPLILALRHLFSQTLEASQIEAIPILTLTAPSPAGTPSPVPGSTATLAHPLRLREVSQLVSHLIHTKAEAPAEPENPSAQPNLSSGGPASDPKAGF